MGYRYSTYQPVPKQRMAPAEGIPHTKYEGGKGSRAYLVYTWHDPAKGYYLLAYRGRRMKPNVWNRYQNEALRDEHCERFLKHYREENEAADNSKALENPLKVGSLLRSSWGYEQTNVDYYQVVKATKRTVVIRQIAAKSVKATGWASDCCAPDRDNFVGKPMTKRVRVFKDRDGASCSVKISACSTAYPCADGETSHRSWYY